MPPKKSRCTWAAWFAACMISYALGAFNGSHWALSGEPSIFRAAPGKAPDALAAASEDVAPSSPREWAAPLLLACLLPLHRCQFLHRANLDH